MQKSSLLLLLALIVAIPIVAQTPEPFIGEAYVNAVEVSYGEAGIILSVSGDLPDSCTELGEITQTLEDDILSVNISTITPADVMCAQVLTPFETTYTLDSRALESGVYGLNVNGIMDEVVIDPTACPKVQEQTYLYDAQGICFLFPEDYTEINGTGFVMISQPNSANALLVVDIQVVEEDASLEALAAEFVGEEFSTRASRLGGQDALIVEDSTAKMRQAYVLFEGQLYIFSLQPITEEAGGEALWQRVRESLFFDGAEE